MKKMPPTVKLYALRLTTFFVVLVAAPLTSMAQSSTGTVSGLTVDEHGDVVPGVEMTLTNEETGLRKQQATDGDGGFVFALLPPARYGLQARRAGFATVTYKSVLVNVGDQKGLKVLMKVGPVAASVTIEDVPLVQPDNSSVSTLVDRHFVENLPLNGRSFDALLELTPGTAVTVAQSYEPGRFSVNGQRPNANYFTIDGVGANVGISPGTFLEQTAAGTTPPVSALGSTNTLVPVDDLQEFRVHTSTYAPEFGRTPGAQVSIITRSGTNAFHGTLFEYFRNEALDANDWFANRQGLDKPAMRQNDFGGVLGGPVLRNRTFFFFSYERLRLRLPRVAITQVPSLSLRQNAPLSVRPLLNAFPAPNGRDFGNGFAEFSASFSNPATVDATSVRIDQMVGSRLLLFGRFNHAPSDLSARGGLGGLSLSVPVSGSFGTTTLTLGATQVVTPRVSNELRFNHSRVRAGTSYPLDDFGGAAPPAASSLFPSPVNPENAQYTLFLPTTALTLGRLAENFQRQLNFVNNLTVAAGAHALRFGVDYRRLAPISGAQEYNLNVAFNTTAAVLSGTASRVTVTANKGRLHPRFTNFSAYAQDTWRARPRLTITYGVRWELNPTPSEANGDDPYTVRGLDDPATMTLAPQGTPFFETTYGNFAPRMGVAYQLSEAQGRETVLRGGFGVFYDLGTGTSGTAFYGANFPNSVSRTVVNAAFPLSPEVLAPRPFGLNTPYSTLFVTDPHLTLPRTYQWHFGGEQSLGMRQSLSASYVGAAA
jgi:outer membrane receptor protein involved in Fe transport